MATSVGDLPFRELLESAPDGMLVCDEHGTILLVNAEVERLFGYARAELIGHRVEVLIPEHLRGRHERHVAGFVANPRLRPMGSDLDLRGRRKDGSELPITSSAPGRTASMSVQPM